MSFRMLDLFSGLGGASEAMVRSSSWDVQRIENNVLLKDVPHTTMADVCELRDELRNLVVDRGMKPKFEIDLLWASPPCREFSLAYASPQSIARREGLEYNPDLEPLQATLEIIDILKPRYWVIENVRGAKRWFEPYIGEQRKVINHSIFLWGNFPDFDPGKIHSKFHKDPHSSDPLRANKRAIIPFSISEGLRNAVESQHTIWQYL